MPQPQNKFDSGHVIVPVAHPSGELHTIAVPAIPENTPSLAEFHDALGNAGYHFPQPSEGQALENHPAFRRAAKSAIAMSGNFDRNEAGFATDEAGTPGKIQTTFSSTVQNAHRLRMEVGPNAFATLHTHPRTSPEPSKDDVENAKKFHHWVYVSSKEGLFAINPTNGEITHVFKTPDWPDKK